MSNARDKANIPSLNFSSTGIDDNATSTAITIDSSERVGIGESSPDVPLHVTSADNSLAYFESTDANANIRFADGNSTGFPVGIGATGTSGNEMTLIAGGSDRVRIDSSGNVGIGTSSPSGSDFGSNTGLLHLKDLDTGNTGIKVEHGSGKSILFNNGSNTFFGSWSNHPLRFYTNSTERIRIDSSGNVGIGTSSPASLFHIESASSDPTLRITNKTVASIDTGPDIEFWNNPFTGSTTNSYESGAIRLRKTNGSNNNHDHYMSFWTRQNSPEGINERMRINSSGNVLVGTTLDSSDTVGVRIKPTGIGTFTVDGGQCLTANRLTSDGEIFRLKKDGTTVGSISSIGGTDVFLGSGDTGLRYRAAQDDIRPANGSADRDNAIDLGDASARFDDIFATNGTIQTSDQNEKQSIQSLTTAEMNVAKRLSPLIKTFKWNSSVEEKGDSARTHTGIIAQDVQQAFTDEGLDAGNYALFISSTWWEKEISVDAVAEEVDEDGNVITEGKDAYTYIDNKEEATDGYTERTRLGVRYPELLSFIQAYNDQRFTELEARITTLETNNP